MRTELTLTRLAALLALSLVAAAGLGCNDHDDPAQAENVVLVRLITPAGTSVAAVEDTTALVEYSLVPRSPSEEFPGTSFYNDITLTSYTVSFTPAVIAPMSGPISTGFCPAATDCKVTIVLVPNASKAGLSGTTVVAHIDFEGRDTDDNPVNFSADVALIFVP